MSELRRGRIRDAVRTEDGAAYMIDNELVVVSELGAVIVDSLEPAGWTSLPDLVRRVTDELGTPEGGDATSIVETGVEALAGSGVLERRTRPVED